MTSEQPGQQERPDGRVTVQSEPLAAPVARVPPVQLVQLVPRVTLAKSARSVRSVPLAPLAPRQPLEPLEQRARQVLLALQVQQEALVSLTALVPNSLPSRHQLDRLCFCRLELDAQQRSSTWKCKLRTSTNVR